MSILYRKYVGVSLIILFALVPGVLWLPYASAANTESLFLSIGQVLALTGSVLLSINFVLSGRFKFLEPVFAGLNQIYIVHHIVGAAAFILLMYHPVFISLSYFQVSGLKAVIKFLLDFSDIPILFGKLALTVIITLLIITFFVRPKIPYQIWKLTHKFMGLGLFLASLHILLIPSTVSVNLPLKIYILTFATLGLAAYTYRVLLYKYLVKRYLYKVISAVKINKEVVEVILSPIEKAISHLPGQFIFIKFKSPGITGEVHPFSLTSATGENNLSLAIKSSGDFTQNIKLLKKGSVTEIEGPFGYFTYSRYENPRQIWIAGGIGITPFLAMARSLESDTKYKIELYYQVSTPDEIVYLEELKNISLKVSNFKVISHFSKTQERISAEVISKKSPDYSSADIFLCGPPPMMASLRSQFRKLGIKNSHIHSEEFALD